MLKPILLLLLIVAVATTSADGRPKMLRRCRSYSFILNWMPNLRTVPDPCGRVEDDPSECSDRIRWLFENASAPGISRFYEEFQKTLIWAPNFCNMDIDGDGLTNGEELGDPKCEWNKNRDLNIMSKPKSHPAICEPVYSEKCEKINGGFVCDGDIQIEAVEIGPHNEETASSTQHSKFYYSTSKYPQTTVDVTPQQSTQQHDPFEADEPRLVDSQFTPTTDEHPDSESTANSQTWLDVSCDAMFEIFYERGCKLEFVRNFLGQAFFADRVVDCWYYVGDSSKNSCPWIAEYLGAHIPQIGNTHSDTSRLLASPVATRASKLEDVKRVVHGGYRKPSISNRTASRIDKKEAFAVSPNFAGFASNDSEPVIRGDASSKDGLDQPSDKPKNEDSNGSHRTISASSDPNRGDSDHQRNSSKVVARADLRRAVELLLNSVRAVLNDSNRGDRSNGGIAFNVYPPESVDEIELRRTLEILLNLTDKDQKIQLVQLIGAQLTFDLSSDHVTHNHIWGDKEATEIERSLIYFIEVNRRVTRSNDTTDSGTEGRAVKTINDGNNNDADEVATPSTTTIPKLVYSSPYYDPDDSHPNELTRSSQSTGSGIDGHFVNTINAGNNNDADKVAIPSTTTIPDDIHSHETTETTRQILTLKITDEKFTSGRQNNRNLSAEFLSAVDNLNFVIETFAPSNHEQDPHIVERSISRVYLLADEFETGAAHINGWYSILDYYNQVRISSFDVNLIRRNIRAHIPDELVSRHYYGLVLTLIDGKMSLVESRIIDKMRDAVTVRSSKARLSTWDEFERSLNSLKAAVAEYNEDANGFYETLDREWSDCSGVHETSSTIDSCEKAGEFFRRDEFLDFVVEAKDCWRAVVHQIDIVCFPRIFDFYYEAGKFIPLRPFFASSPTTVQSTFAISKEQPTTATIEDQAAEKENGATRPADNDEFWDQVLTTISRSSSAPTIGRNDIVEAKRADQIDNDVETDDNRTEVLLTNASPRPRFDAGNSGSYILFLSAAMYLRCTCC